MISRFGFQIVEMILKSFSGISPHFSALPIYFKCRPGGFVLGSQEDSFAPQDTKPWGLSTLQPLEVEATVYSGLEVKYPAVQMCPQSAQDKPKGT